MPHPNWSEQDLDAAQARLLARSGGVTERGGVERHVVIAADLRITSDGTFPQTRAGVNPAPSPLAQSFTLYGQLCSGKNQIQLLWRNGKVQQ